jgi:23S rRNA-/tRNA-specific pseudouridylate synthase
LTKDNKEYKYYTKAAQYYRDILLEESKNKDTKNIKKPSLKEGIEILYQDEYLNLFNKI